MLCLNTDLCMYFFEWTNKDGVAQRVARLTRNRLAARSNPTKGSRLFIEQET